MTYSLKTVEQCDTSNILWWLDCCATWLLKEPQNCGDKQLISSLDILLVSLSNFCLPPRFRFQKIQDTINSTMDNRRILMQKTSHPATSVFFFSATSKLSHSLGVGPVRRYDSLHVEGETRNHGNRSVMSSSAHSCVGTCRNHRLLPTLLFTYLYLILVLAITVSETELTVKNARLQLTKNKMALGWSMNS